MQEPMLSIHPSRLVAYMSSTEGAGGNKVQLLTGADVRNAQIGLLSKRARIRLNLALRALIYLAEYKTVFEKESGKTFRFKLNFVTLTLPASTTLTDKQIVRNVLHPFLDKWKKRNVKLLYVWKAECQDNGRLHFHLTTNQFIHYERLRTAWNKQCQKAGIHNEKVGLSANSTDVHAVKGIRNLAAYLCGYVTKKDLYKKPLKRWLSRYKQQLSDIKRQQVDLPRKYFTMLKRRPTCALWGASRALLKSNISENVEGSQAGSEFHTFATHVAYDFQNDYISLWNLHAREIDNIPNIANLWRQEMNKRLKADNLNEKRYYQI